MSHVFWRACGLALFTLTLSQFPVLGEDAPNVERRMQPQLKISGTFQANGFAVSSIDQTGPGANMSLLGSDTPTRGILDPGDVIVAIDGKAFRDDIEFYELLYQGFKAGDGKLTLSVLDVKTDRVARWSVTPVLALRDVPVRATATALKLKKLPAPLPALKSLPDDLR